MQCVEELSPEALFDLDEIEALPAFDAPAFPAVAFGFADTVTASATTCTVTVTLVAENPYDGVLCYAQSPFGLCEDDRWASRILVGGVFGGGFGQLVRSVGGRLVTWGLQLLPTGPGVDDVPPGTPVSGEDGFDVPRPGPNGRLPPETRPIPPRTPPRRPPRLTPGGGIYLPGGLPILLAPMDIWLDQMQPRNYPPVEA